MKKFLCLLTSVILSCSLTFSSFAHTSDTTKTVSKKYIEYTQNGYIYEVDTTECNHSFYKDQTKTVSRTATYKTPTGNPSWSMTIIASFKYNGSSSSCTSSKVETKVYHSAWKITNKTSSHSKNTATAKVTAKLYNNSVVVQTKTKTLTLTCSKTGVIS